MRAWEIKDGFGIDRLTQTERAQPPPPGPGQVLVRVGAVSLNYRDLIMVKGIYNPRQPLPLVPLSDGAGVVAAVGRDVTRVRVGERIASCFFQGWTEGELTDAKARTSLGSPLDGMLQEYILLDEAGAVPVPDHLSDEEAATLPCAAVTAWHALISKGGLTAGDTVLVQGTGGVSLFALQFAGISGARVIITSSSGEKLARAGELGASDLINYRSTPDWEKSVREVTGGTGCDHVVEVGGAGTLAKSFAAVRRGGTVSLIGVLTGGGGEVNPMPILMNGIRVQGIYVGSREMFERMNRAISLRRLRPVVDRIFPFEETREAFRYMERAAHFGKITIKFD